MTVETNKMKKRDAANEKTNVRELRSHRGTSCHMTSSIDNVRHTMENAFTGDAIQTSTKKTIRSKDIAPRKKVKLMNDQTLTHLDRISPSLDNMTLDSNITIDGGITKRKKKTSDIRATTKNSVLQSKIRKHPHCSDVVSKYSLRTMITRQSARNQVRPQIAGHQTDNGLLDSHAITEDVNLAKVQIMSRKVNQQAIDQAAPESRQNLNPASIRSTSKHKLARYPANLHITTKTVKPLAIMKAEESLPRPSHFCQVHLVASNTPTSQIVQSNDDMYRDRSIPSTSQKAYEDAIDEIDEQASSEYTTPCCKSIDSSSPKADILCKDLWKALKAPVPTETTTLKELRQVLQQQEETLEDVEEIKSCNICLCYYNAEEVTPKFLICGHTLCVGCCAKLAEGCLVRCPFCRTRTMMKTKNVAEGLPVTRAFLTVNISRSDALSFLRENRPTNFDI